MTRDPGDSLTSGRVDVGDGIGCKAGQVFEREIAHQHVFLNPLPQLHDDCDDSVGEVFHERHDQRDQLVFDPINDRWDRFAGPLANRFDGRRDHVTGVPVRDPQFHDRERGPGLDLGTQDGPVL